MFAISHICGTADGERHGVRSESESTESQGKAEGRGRTEACGAATAAAVEDAEAGAIHAGAFKQAEEVAIVVDARRVPHATAVAGHLRRRWRKQSHGEKQQLDQGHGD